MPSLRSLGVVLGVLSLGASVLLGFGGAAWAPRGLWIGLPSFLAVALVTVIGVGLGRSRRARTGLLACGGLAAPLALLVSGTPPARVVSGPILLALASAGAVLVVVSAGWRPPRRAFLPLAYTVLLLAACRSHLQVGAKGDEPHYMMVAESLLQDGDVSLERDYAEMRYAAFHDPPLPAHYRVRGRQREIYSLHAVGLSVLILPAWALAGYAGVTVFMALVAALLAFEVRGFARDLTGREDVGDAVGWLLVLSPPLLHYAGLVFTEVPAALLVAVGLRRGTWPALSRAGAWTIGITAACLPWLNVRYAPLAALVLLHAVWRHRQVGSLARLAVPSVVSTVGIAAYHQVLYGFWDPRRVYGRRPEFAPSTLLEGLPGLLLDQEFGLLVYVPVLVLCGFGLVLLARRDRRLGWISVAAVASVLLMAGSWHMWRGGFNPPGRFLVPILPILAVALAVVFLERGLTAGTAVLVGFGVWTGLTGACEPRLVHRDRDGTAPLFRTHSGAREWTALLPGYVLADAERHRLAGVWASALLLAVPWRRRRPGPVRVAVAALGLAVTAQTASALTTARTEDRDAVRLLGRPALALPAWSRGRAAAEWPAAALGWGPVYEPHRYPAGAEIGRRLGLSAGRYRLVLEGEDLTPARAAPFVDVWVDGSARAHGISPMRRDRGGWTTEIHVPEAVAVTLRLREGGAVLLQRVRLEAQP